jgi:hypothetical protein
MHTLYHTMSRFNAPHEILFENRQPNGTDRAHLPLLFVPLSESWSSASANPTISVSVERSLPRVVTEELVNPIEIFSVFLSNITDQCLDNRATEAVFFLKHRNL